MAAVTDGLLPTHRALEKGSFYSALKVSRKTHDICEELQSGFRSSTAQRQLF